MGVAMDWGLLWNSPSPRFGLGFAVLNLGRQFRAYTKDGVDDMALNTRIRIASHYRPAAIRGLTVFGDMEFPRYTQPLFHVGGEYQAAPWLALRGGVQRPIIYARDMVQSAFGKRTMDDAADAGLPYGSVGAGIKWSQFNLDYSLVFLRYEIGQTHRLELRTGF
jgi:hypothetical protein